MLEQQEPNTKPDAATPTPPEPIMASGGAPSADKKKMWMIVTAVVLVIIIVVGGVWMLTKGTAKKTATTTAKPKFHIGLSLDTYKELRWQKDRDLIVKHAKELGGDVTVLVADSDDAKQVSQIENLISQKMDVIIVVAHDSKAVAPTVAEAHKAGVEIVAYDRLILDSDVDAYVTFDSTLLGKYEAQHVMDAVPATVKPANVALVGGAESDNNSALVRQGIMGVLQPMIDSGRVKVVYDKYTQDWSADVAYTNIKDFLDKGNKLDAVVAANDGTAGGVIKALKTHSLDGKVPVSGSDAELPAVQRVVAGTQTMTIYTPFSNLANKAVDLAYELASNKKPTTNAKVNNGKIDVPSFLLDSVPITKDNIKTTLIKDGVFTNEEVYGTQ